MFTPVTMSPNFTAGLVVVTGMTATKVDGVRHRGTGTRGVLGDDRPAVAQEIDQRTGVDLPHEVLKRGVSSPLRVYAELKRHAAL